MTLSETINKMMETILESAEFTSANPTHINRLIQINTLENPDLEKEIQQLIKKRDSDDLKDNLDFKKQQEQIKESTETIKRIKESNLQDVMDMTTAQFGNIKSFAVNPTGFIVQSVFRKLAKGAGVLIIVTLIFEAVKFIIDELLKPGRLLDRRFKRDINEEILAFRRREEKQKLAQGYSRLIITSMPRLRGGQDQVYDSFREIASGRPVFPNGTFMVEPPQANVTGFSSKGKGKRNRSVFR